MRERDELAVARCAQLQVMPGLGAISRNGESLIAGGHDFHRPADFSRNSGDPMGAWIRALGAESAPDVARDGTDIVGIYIELRGNRRFGSPHELGGFINCELVRIPRAGHSEKLDWIMVLCG